MTTTMTAQERSITTITTAEITWDGTSMAATGTQRADALRFLTASAGDALRCMNNLKIHSFETASVGDTNRLLVITATGQFDSAASVHHLRNLNNMLISSEIRPAINNTNGLRDGLMVSIRCVWVRPVWNGPLELVPTPDWPLHVRLGAPLGASEETREPETRNPILAAVCKALGVKP